ncbi:MAG: cellulase family glycosylhydrolase [Candidatus Zipacnadales bacterium]
MIGACLISMLAGTVAGETVLLHDFEEVSLWQPNPDGGHAGSVSQDAEFAHEGKGMRIRYVDEPPHWGNLIGPCQVPREAFALRFWVYIHSAQPEAAMHIWLMEPDHDAWVQRVRFGEGELAQLQPGWYEVIMPIEGFRFEPRGAKTRQMTTVERMLIGCNFASLEVTIDTMSWDIEPILQRLPLPKTEGLIIERGDKGSIGILDMGEGLPNGFVTTHPPARIAEVATEAGFGVTLLQAGDLADEQQLTPENFDAIVLPWGPYFPAEAKETFLAYLRAGGSFLSTDGYAFDELVYLTHKGWTTLPTTRNAAEMDQAEESADSFSMNSRHGKPGDAITLQPWQIGGFDPQFHVEYATSFRPVGVRAPADLRYEFAEPVKGFSACVLTGVNGPVFPLVYRRWVPVLEAYDRAGQLRGTALSIAHNFAGEYPKSSWAFSGITSGQDLFLEGPQRRELLIRVLTEIVEKVFLHGLTSDLALYEAGETATVTVQVTNNGRRAVLRELVIRVDNQELVKEFLELQPGTTHTRKVLVEVDSLKGDLIPLQASLVGGERVVDVIESAFCIRNEHVLASGPKIGWADNYMTVDGRPTFLVGTNQTGMMYFSPDEGPATWDRDFAAMQAHGFHIWRILHFSPFAAKGYEGHGQHTSLDLANRPQKLIRQMDAIVQLAQKHRVAIFLSLHDWLGIVLTEEELAAQADWNRFWADRYRNVPGIFYDIQNEPSIHVEDRPDIIALWNKFLQERYGTDDVLREAWTRTPPEKALPNVPLGAVTEEWDDVRAADRKRFETELLNRWVKANVDGIRAGDPEALICVGYLPSMPPADKIFGVKHTDFSNMHYYGPVERMPVEFKAIDRRFQGKGFSLGEFGAQEAHDARVQGRTEVPVEASIHRFQTYIHYAVGMGAAFITNWDWKEFNEALFPWGLLQRGSRVPKPWLHTLAQEALLVSLIEPSYEPPEVFVVAPDSHRIGPRFNELHGALTRSIELLLNQQVNFGIVNEEDITDLPLSAKAVFWPVPYCPTDEVFGHIFNWVKEGGTLYLSGDVQFDRTRKPTRGQRRTLLGLPPVPPAHPFAILEEAWHAEPLQTRVGNGNVLYVPYPLELRRQVTDSEVYKRCLEVARVKRVEVMPVGGRICALSLPTRDGGQLYMLARMDDAGDLCSITLPAANLTVQLLPKGFSFVLLGKSGEVLGVESQGAILIGDKLVAQASGHYGIGALDGCDVRQSEALVILPHQLPEVKLFSVQEDERTCYVGTADGSAGHTTVFDGAVDFSDGAPGRIAVVARQGKLNSAKEELRRRLERRVGQSR